jgi:hypothetical protein
MPKKVAGFCTREIQRFTIVKFMGARGRGMSPVPLRLVESGVGVRVGVYAGCVASTAPSQPPARSRTALAGSPPSTS